MRQQKWRVHRVLGLSLFWNVLTLLAAMGSVHCAGDDDGPSVVARPDAEPIDTGGLPDTGGSADADPVDLGPPDSGVLPDADPADMGFEPDAGFVPVCPDPDGPNGPPECVQAADCAADFAPPSNCSYCRAYNAAICERGTCASPPILGGTEGVFMRFSIVGITAEIRSFAGAVVATETTGGATIDCGDVYGPEWDLTEVCYNWLDSRFATNLGEPAQAFPFRFGRFPGGRRVLLIVYAFGQDNARGDPLGVSCTEVDVPPAGTRNEDLQVTGDTMRQLP